jgi:hypothetical protein
MTEPLRVSAQARCLLWVKVGPTGTALGTSGVGQPGPPSERLELGVNRTSWPEKQTWPIEGPLSGEERTLFVRGCQDRS